jgi:threonine synthase
MYAIALRCSFCGTDFPLTNQGTCTNCARIGEESALNETLGVVYDLPALKQHLDRDELVRRPAGIWRYHELLPVSDPAFRIDLGAGGTRLAQATRLPETQTISKLFFKVEGSNPSGSFKDRPIGVAASVALEHGARGLACLTSGNIGSAMAAAAAKAAVPSLVFLLNSAGGAAQKANVNVEKYVQISSYGASVLTPVGSLDELMTLADRVELEMGWTFMHTMQAYQPDGDKTTAFEICEQLDWQPPAAVFVPTGTGTNLFGLWQGFRLFHELGFIDRVPRMFSVQPQGAASLAHAWNAHAQIPALLTAEPNVAPPITHRVSGYHAYRAIIESQGGAVGVSDTAMLSAVKDLASHEGIYAEAASAAALAGIRTALADHLLDQDEINANGVVGILTSHGLKNSLALSSLYAPPPQMPGTWDNIAPFLSHQTL